MKKNPNRFWVLVILLGWVFDFLFWEKPVPGINFFLYVVLCLATGIYILYTDGLRLSRRSGLLLLPIAFFAAVTFIRQEPMTVFLSVAMTIFLLGIFALTFINGEWMKYGLLDYLFGFLRLFGSMLARPIGFTAEVRREQPSTASDKRPSPIWPVVRGVVIALPVIAIFASLLSAADPIFAKRFGDFIKLFNIDNLPEYIFRFVYILVFAYALAGVFLHAAQKSGEAMEEKNFISPFLGFTESTIVLGSVVVLFVAFVAIQFQYFFGGQANIHIDGYTYSEYARKGFGELVAVAFFSLLLLLGLGAITRRETDAQRRTFTSLGVALVGLVLVMLVSAFQRLALYEYAYGFSRLRTYTHVFVIWLALLLVAVVILEALRRERSIGLTMVLASLGFVVSLSLLNVDGFIVKQNVQREQRENTANTSSLLERPDLDAQYFLDLSDDAVPTMVAAFTDTSLPYDVREKLGAALTCKRYERKQGNQVYPWQAFHLSRYQADIAFETVKQELDTYKIIDKDWPVKVETPNGKEFSCSQYYYD
ncbi:MAG: DUF4173 domain-containing protein [Anaerolineales bacterium]|nr:DUF4173 domain-containing protein [Anaerolineales bacterium]